MRRMARSFDVPKTFLAIQVNMGGVVSAARPAENPRQRSPSRTPTPGARRQSSYKMPSALPEGTFSVRLAAGLGAGNMLKFLVWLGRVE